MDSNTPFAPSMEASSKGDEIRVTVIAAGFDKLGGNGRNGRNGRLSRVLEGEPASRQPVPSLLAEEEEEEEMFTPAPAKVTFEADEEDLDIPDFLKS